MNQVVFHGYAYNGQFDGENSVNGFIKNVKWPGFDGFSSSTWSNSFGERQPNWIFAKSYLDFLTRNQFILRQGTPKVDLAIYYQNYYETIDFIGSKKIFDDGGILEQHGYSYDFLSPAALKNLSVKNNRLDFDGASYKALILNHQENLTADAEKKLLEFAKAGLPIIVIGKAPKENSFLSKKYFLEKMGEIMQLPAVTQIRNSEQNPEIIFETLQSLGIIPDASYQKNNLLAVHRNDSNIDYYYLHNYGNVKNFGEVSKIPKIDTKISLTGAGTPYKLNAWTGEVTKIKNFTRNGDKVEVPIQLAGNDSIIIALTDEKISDVEEVEKNFAAPIQLNDWNLQIESWTKGNNPTSMKKEIINVGKLEKLVAWNQIKNLQKVSGIGTYTTAFNLEKNFGAELQLQGAKDTIQVKVNGQIVALDPIEGRVDISKFAVEGKNNLEIKVASTLLNALLKENTDDKREIDNYGLFGNIFIKPYKK